jgi:hypothetical protein
MQVVDIENKIAQLEEQVTLLTDAVLKEREAVRTLHESLIAQGNLLEVLQAQSANTREIVEKAVSLVQTACSMQQYKEPPNG